MAHVGRRASNWGCYIALGIALAVLPSAAFAKPQAEPEGQGARTPKPTSHDPQLAAPDAVEAAKKPPDCNSPKDAEELGACAESESAKTGVWQAWGLFLTLIATASAAIAAGISAKAAEKAVQKSEELLAHSEESSERQLRAYVTISDAIMDLQHPNTRGHWEATLTIKNGGQTPAYKVRTKFVIEGDAEPFLKGVLGIPPDVHNISESIIGPGEDMKVTLEVSDEVSIDKFYAIRDGRAIIWIVGRIIYEDIFRNEQWVTARMSTGGPDALGASGEFRPHSTGNAASEQGKYKRRRT